MSKPALTLSTGDGQDLDEALEFYAHDSEVKAGGWQEGDYAHTVYIDHAARIRALKDRILAAINTHELRIVVALED